MKVPTTKEIKNPDSPGGRKDWEGRSPRVRLSLTHAQLAILADIFNAFFLRFPEKAEDENYVDLAERINGALQDIQKPLVKETEVATLWDTDDL